MKKGIKMVNNTVKTTLRKLWQYGIGTRLEVEGKLYLFIGKSPDGVEELYDYKAGLMEYCEYDKNGVHWEDEMEILVYKLDKDLDTLIKCKTNGVLSLVQDGWSLDEKSKYIDLQRDLGAIKVLKELQSVLDESRNK